MCKSRIPDLKWFNLGMRSVQLTVLMLSAGLACQVLPPVWNFTPVQYGADNQNWSVDQTDRGWMYFGNNGGLLEYNGANWTRYDSPNGSVIRAVRAVDNRVYTGCYMEFGYWEANHKGELEYNSLSSALKDSLLPDEQFWRIYRLGSWVMFESLQRIYAFNTENSRFDIIPAASSRAQLFGDSERMFYRKDDTGLLAHHNGTSTIIIPADLLGNQVLTGMFILNGRRSWITENGTLFMVDSDKITTQRPVGLAGFPSVKVYSGIQLADGTMALGTISEGLILLSEDGELISKIGKQEGLSNNTVLSVFEDTDQNIWLALDNGISVVNRGSAFSEYQDKNGDLGVVYAAREFQGKLYLGTNQGLFQGELGGDDFSIVPGTEGQVWSIQEFDGILICGHNNGTYQIRDNQAKSIGNAAGTWSIKSVPGTDSLLLQGGYGGLSVLERTTYGWEFRNSVSGFGISSRFFEFLDTNRLLVNHEYKGVYELGLNPDKTEVIDSLRTPAFGYGASLFEYQKQVYYANSSGVFQYQESKGFVPDSIFNELLHTGADDPVGVLISETQSQRLWGIGNRTIYSILPDPFGEGLRMQNIPVPEGFRRNMGIVGFECVVPLIDGRYLIGKTDGYLLLNLEQLRNSSPDLYIIQAQRYHYNTDSVETLSLLKSGVRLPYGQSSIQISYASPVYDKYTEVQYQYWLEGFQEGWSGWSSQTTARFDNLTFGSYRFHVRARIGNQQSEEDSLFEFEIDRPWYLTVWALMAFGLLGLGVVFGVHRSYRAYYRRQQRLLHLQTRKKLKQKALKAKKKMVEMRNSHLRNEIESKNRELAVSTMSIIKKNEFLSAIKEQLQRTEGAPEKLQAVIRTIDQQINNEEDWEFFESAFNNADQDFLQNIKKFHPDLTPNDLKLCAYLRLNLSSKEIAPLLNISVRSVEVKRYRLRKKMGLEHEEGLVSYILAL